MGNKSNKLKPAALRECMLVSKKRFTETEVKNLHAHFLTISAINDDDGLIDVREFKSALGLSASNFFVERIFHIFDINGDGKINFSEFLAGLSVLCLKAPDKDKLYFSFRIYDIDEDGKISKAELHKMMTCCLKCFPHKFTEEQTTDIIDKTFKEADTNKDGYIDFDEYSSLVANHPLMLSQMSINVKQKIAEMQKGGKLSSKMAKMGLK